MTFNDIFKSSFLSNVASVSLFDMILAMVLAFAIGIFIYFVYRKAYSGVTSFQLMLVLPAQGLNLETH